MLTKTLAIILPANLKFSMYKLLCLFVVFVFVAAGGQSQSVKILFDAFKAETAGNADWIIDADANNIGYPNGKAVVGQGNESNAQKIPTPAQSGINTNTPETYWKGGLSYWAIDCVKSGYTVETLPYNGKITYGDNSNTQDLKNYKVFVVCEPNIQFTSSEKIALLNFVKDGGGLLIVGDHDNSDRNNDGWDSPHIWNDFFTSNGTQNNPFGMSFDYKDIIQTSSNIASLPDDSVLHGSYGNVTQVEWSGGTTLTISPTANSTVKGIIYTTGSSHNNNNVMVAHCYYGKGKVVTVTDSSPCDDGTGDDNDNLYNGYTADANGNHRILLMNAVIWLAASGGILPVHFISFTGSHSATGNILQFTTGDAASVVKFTIQSSADGIYFTDKKEITANANQSAYTYTEPAANSITYYRIKAAERSGEEVYSQVIAIKNNESTSSFKVSPNPVRNAATIIFNSNSGGTIHLYNQQSNLLLAKEIAAGTQQYMLDATALSAGIYFISYTSDGKKSKQKIVVAK
ncbi:MAG TPA: T9SS type A sorting domain-containing protein [Chitinophagaceae bacterium]|nr:T9SS type A sorting domain-containing protein [Chitinophagaceae bacterium]